ncbi:hypothetical protein PM082_015900 [Marasmius tenuissimus]|nr:hypothetical protein PM082_015900 [Marasmius tenuissimus]
MEEYGMGYLVDWHRGCKTRARFEAACIRTLKTLVAQEFKHPIWTASELYTFERLVDSSLFQDCAFGSELFAQCRELFPLKGKIVSLDRALYTEGGFDSHSTVSQIFKKLDISRTGIERRRKKVLDWVKAADRELSLVDMSTAIR